MLVNDFLFLYKWGFGRKNWFKRMTAPFTPPAVDKSAFHCPHCQTYAMQNWYAACANKTFNNATAHEHLVTILKSGYGQELKDRVASGKPVLVGANNANQAELVGLYVSHCAHCYSLSIWLKDKQIYPFESSAPPPNPDLPVDLHKDYEEARSILHHSPRGAAALLRLVIQKLCKELGESGNNINDDIKRLAKKGLDQTVIDALDSVRVIGNHSIHPGQMNLTDDTPTVLALFELINIVVEKMITYPKKVKKIRRSLPAKDKANIQKRDAK